jgi:hypothetical protein
MRTAALALGVTLSVPALAQEEAVGQKPPTSVHYLQYGVALVAEGVASGGNVCPAGAETPCILGPGGGLAVRVGYRSRGAWYVGGAYEFSRQDSSNLMRLAILQQLRAETRYYFDEGNRITPYVTAGGGAVLYGNEWSNDTGGIQAFAGIGAEFQMSERAVVGAALVYRPLLLRGWNDATGEHRADEYLGFGFAHLLAFEVTLELRDALSRW